MYLIHCLIHLRLINYYGKCDMQILYLVEGQTEKELLSLLNVYGKIEIFNLWETDVSKIFRKFKSDTIIYIVYDTDKCPSIIRFENNLNLLIQQKRLKGILQQTLNLEDEIAYACGLSKQQLFKAFGVSGNRNFKTSLLEINNPLQKLKSMGFDEHLLWTKALDYRLNQKYSRWLKRYEHLTLK